MKNSVSELIETGRYFDTGLRWYFDKYLGFFWQRRLFVILCSIVFFTLLYISLSNYEILLGQREQFFHQKITKRIVMYVETLQDYPKVTKLQHFTISDPNILLARFLVNKYVTIMESYDYNSLEFSKSFILNNSTNFIYSKFEELIDITNPNSYILLYGYNTIIQVDVKDIQIMLNDFNIPSRAIVNFNKLYYSGRNLVRVVPCMADIEFFTRGIYSILGGSGEFPFTVLRYQVNEKE